MRLNWKTAAASIAALAFVVLAIQSPRDEGPSRREMNSSTELRYKQQMLEQDVRLTEQLCRKQCRTNLLSMISKQPQDSPRSISGEMLEQMQNKHPHMRYLEARTNGQLAKHGDPENIPDEVEPYLELARDTIRFKSIYESPKIRTDDGPYIVVAVREEDGEGYVLGAVQQQVLEHVRREQRKNLRLVPYPSEARFGIQAADSDTLRKVDVDHPEENENISHYYENEVVVKFFEQPDDSMLARIGTEIDADRSERAGYAFVFHSRTWSTEKLIEYFHNNFQVQYVEPHYMYVTNQTPNDALYEQYQWNLPAIQTEQGWAAAAAGEEIIVAVVDTGVDTDHPDLRDSLVGGYNVYSNGTDAYDDVGHGTHVAGIIAAQINNYEGIAGVAPRTKIMPVKVLDSSGAGSTYAVAQGIIWATDNGAQVINLSLGNYAQAQFLHDAIRYAYDRNVVLIAATGNDSTESPGYPAAYPEVFAVGATDANQSVAQFSNFGDYLDVAAPGVSIASTYPGNQYAALSGTSMASPHVAALAAMIRSVNPTLTNEQIMELMRSSSIDLGDAGHDIYYGYGQINVAQAIRAASNSGQSVVKWSDNLKSGIERIIAKYE